MDFKWVKHAFPRYNDLFWLLFNRETADERCYFLGGLPLGKLTKTLLASPY
jgi:hypothetical protein